MKNGESVRKPKVVVALGPRETATAAVAMGELICRLAGADIKLVHVVSPLTRMRRVIQYRYMADFTPETEMGIVDLEDEGHFIAGKGETAHSYADILAKIDPAFHAEIVLLQGDIEEAVMDYAASQRALMVLIGSKTNRLRILPAFFSQTMQFMSDSRIPVLVVPHDWKVDKNKTFFHILIVDDMAKVTNALPFAVDLAGRIQRCALFHIRVQDYAEHIGLVGDYGVSGYFGEYVYPFRDYDPAAMHADNCERIELELKDRFIRECERQDIDPHSFNYEAKFLLGNISREIERSAQEFDSDFVVYGGHQGESQWDFFNTELISDRAKLRQHFPILIASMPKAG